MKVEIAGRALTTLAGVESFPTARSVDASSNCLVELKLLSALPQLHTLNVSRNELTTVLDFSVAHTGEHEGAAEEAEAKGGEVAALSFGSRLEVADLSFNRISVMRDLSHHKFLTRLNLASNALTSVRGLRGLQYLRFLDLSKNAISTLVDEGGSDGVGAMDSLGLVELRLEQNAIESLAALGSLPRLQTLTVAQNQIASMRGLDGCPSLVELDIRSNRVSEVVELARLVSGLRALQTVGNPMNDEDSYRERAVLLVPSLRHLDETEVFPIEKMSTINKHGGDVEHRQEVLRELLPGEPFVDYCPPLDAPKLPEE